MSRHRCRISFTALLAALATLAGSPAAVGDVADLREHVSLLAGPELEGRLTGTAGEREAAEYLVAELAEIGAETLPGLDGYRQPFEFTAGSRDVGSTIALSGPDLDRDWTGGDSIRALSFSDSRSVAGEVVFAGYGLVVPPGQDFPYDSYAGLDVEGKVVLVLRYFPEDVDQETRALLARYSGLRYKAMQARERGAAALLVVTGPRSPNAGETIPMSFDTAISGSGIAAASISGEVGEALFSALEGKDLEAAQTALDDGNPHVAGFPIPGVAVELDVEVEREKRTGVNVLGLLPATAPAAAGDPMVVVGAHYDHLGRGAGGNSLARKEEAGEVHHGADDNASGVAALLEIGEALAGRERPRGVVLAFWSGEELGVLGSAHFVKSGVLPAGEIQAYVNLDMVGRMREEKLTVQAVGSSPAWPRLIEQTNVPVGFALQTSEDPYLPTDSSSFNQIEVPNLHLFTGSHEDYHRPTDTAEKIAYEELDRVVRFTTLLVSRLAALDERPEFVAVEPETDLGGDRDTLRAFTGTIPDYTTEVEGLLLSGVIGGGPADEAGLTGGDVIVELGGQEIRNIYDYTYALDAVKIGEPTKVVFLRDGERMEATITPRARE